MTKKIFLLMFAMIFTANISNAQTKAMDFNKTDCNGATHHLFADLDAGNAVLLFFYMPNCTMCPPPAQKVDKMLSNVLKKYPGKIKCYVMPYNNTTKCSDVFAWVNTNYLMNFIPLDSGATEVAHCGGFGMPTVALFGGKDHRMMFSDVGFSSRDTTDMKDSITALLSSAPAGIENLPNVISSFKLFPNPASKFLNINLSLKERTTLSIDIKDISGGTVAVLMNSTSCNSIVSKQFNTSALPNGNYFVTIKGNGINMNEKFIVNH